MNRRDAMQGIATALLAPCWPVGQALAAGLGFAWGVVPTIAMVGPVDDPRQALVRDAVAFWNQTLDELRSGFRLGAVARQERSVPDDLIVVLSESTLKGMKRPFPEQLGSIPGDIVVALSDADFVSFSMRLVDWERTGRYPKRSRLPADPTQRCAQRDRPRTRARNRPNSQQRSNDANVRASGPVPADGVSICDQALFSTHQR